jgi:hypothetical protein
METKTRRRRNEWKRMKKQERGRDIGQEGEKMIDTMRGKMSKKTQ